MGHPAVEEIRIYQGDHYRLGVRILTGGVAMDLSGSTLRAQVRERTDGPVLAEFDVAMDPLVSNRAILTLTPDQTEVLPNKCVWDLQLTDAGGMVRTLVRGPARVGLEVTREEAP
jgi:hypothetical protein